MPIMMGKDTNKKGVASLILSRMKPSGQTEQMGESEDGKSPDSLSEGERSAGEEMITAFHEKDVVGLVNAFKSLVEIIDGDEDKEEGEGGEEGSEKPEGSSIFG